MNNHPVLYNFSFDDDLDIYDSLMRHLKDSLVSDNGSHHHENSESLSTIHLDTDATQPLPFVTEYALDGTIVNVHDDDDDDDETTPVHAPRGKRSRESTVNRSKRPRNDSSGADRVCSLVTGDSKDVTDSSSDDEDNIPPDHDDNDDDSSLEGTATTTCLAHLLPAIHSDDVGKKCLVLDMDETLLHSNIISMSDGANSFSLPVQFDGEEPSTLYVTKRPGVDQFLADMAQLYEIVVFTAGTQQYADPLLDQLDPHHQYIRTRLFRDSCLSLGDGRFVKDLSLLGRDLSQTIIVDNSPLSYSFHPTNAIDCSTFLDDESDTELSLIARFLTAIRTVKDVRNVLSHWREWPLENKE